MIYTITVDNGGPCDADNVVVTDILPAGVTFNATSGYSEEPNGITNWSLGDIMANDYAEFTIDITPDINTVGIIANVASVTAGTIDPDPGNNSADEDTEVITECGRPVGQFGGNGR